MRVGSRRAITIAGVAAFASLAGPALAQFFSPGKLARPHSGLEGLAKCKKCHQEEKSLSAKSCLDCHTEISARIAKSAGFHGRMQPANRDACQTCHPDHRGLDFSMIEWEGGREHFDHQRTGWPLRGAHTKPRCEDCHQRPLISDASIRRMLDKSGKALTFLGVSERCDACHFDEHRNQVGRDCAKCHDEKAWKPEPGFNHQKTAYPLLAKHKDVPCAKCHRNLTDEKFLATASPRPRAATFVELKPIEFKSCESCHKDPHKGSLGPACASCHDEAGWKIIKTDKGRDTGFHDKTRFPLRGGHIGVACQSCHGPFPGQPAKFKGMAFGACTDCHEDAHLGQLKPTPPAKVAACDKCHTVNAFASVRYELEQHAKTEFPLTGAHQVADCRGCHPMDERLAGRITQATHSMLAQHKRPELFSLAALHPPKKPEACSGCHEDVHRGQFLSAEGVNDCAACHKPTSFSDLKFDHKKQSRFPLTGKHAETTCVACHKLDRPKKEAPAFVRYKPIGMSCGSCHADVHQGQFLAATARPPSAQSKTHDCDLCHDTKDFKKTLFDHNNPHFTSYPLEGQHAKVQCSACHPKVHVTETITTVRYRPVPRACEDCHVDIHHGAFRGFEP